MTKSGPYDLNTIVTGDARELAEAIPDESVDLIFTDPVYDRIDDYRWLAETAARVLKPDRACLAWQATPLLATTIPAMSALTYAWLLYWQRHGHIAPGRAGICVITTCLWFEKGRSKTYKKMADWAPTINGGPSARTHKWGKPLGLMAKWVNCFTVPGHVLFDPFGGSGVLPAACRIVGRDYIAFEIDPDTAAMARQRVAETQPPLPIVMAEQQGFDLAGVK